MDTQIHLLILHSNIISAYTPLLSSVILKTILGYYNKYLHIRIQKKNLTANRKRQECRVVMTVFVDWFVKSHLINCAISTIISWCWLGTCMKGKQ